MTLEIDSPRITECVQEYMGAPSGTKLHSDATRAHWNNSSPHQQNDVMLPYIHFDSTATSRCTVEMVIESRPEWTTNLCTKNDDCHGGTECLSIGRHWISVCQIPPEATLTKPFNPAHAVAQFSVFSAAVSILWVGIVACLRRPTSICQTVRSATKA
jgi:hypothetical protein